MRCEGVSSRDPDPKLYVVPGRGICMDGDTFRVGKPSESGGERGSISGWSQKSRQRMRSWLLWHDAPDGWETYGVTLTVPGNDVENVLNGWPEFLRRFLQSLKLSGIGCVWRVELQGRGMPHLHCIVVLPRDKSLYHNGKRVASLGLDRREEVQQFCFLKWRYYLEKMVPIDRGRAECRPNSFRKLRSMGYSKTEIKRNWRVECNPSDDYSLGRFELPGADEYSVDVQCEGDRVSWLRYLQDHATKGKQQQIGRDIGRHWGVVNRAVFVDCEERELRFPRKKDYCRFHRLVRRLHAGTEPADCIFGRKVRKGLARGRPGLGSAVFFLRDDTIRRMYQNVISRAERDGAC